MDSNTLSGLRQELGIVMGGCKTGTTTSSGDSTSVIDATNFTDSYMNANYYDGWYCILTSGTYSGQIRRVSSYAGATGDFTVADAFGGTVGNTVTFEVHSYDPAELKQAINRALPRLYYWTYAYPTLAADGDMEASGVTNWTGSSSTPTKSTTVAKEGTQSLVSTNSGTDGYVRTASMSATAGDTYYAEVMVRPDNFAVSFIAYDVTGSAVIKQIDHSGGREWKRLWMDFTIPSGCNQIQLRLSATSASAVTYWDNLILQHVDETRLALPSWMSQRGNVIGIERRIRSRDQASGVEYADEERYTPLIPQPHIEEDRTAVNPLYLQLPYTISDRPIRARCVRPYGTLSADTSTTTAPKDWVVAGAVLDMLRSQIMRAPGDETKELKSQLTAWKKDFERLCRINQPRVTARIRSAWDA